jgi:hypothetical protein
MTALPHNKVPGLPDFFGANIPKLEKYIKMTKNYLFQTAINYTK